MSEYVPSVVNVGDKLETIDAMFMFCIEEVDKVFISASVSVLAPKPFDECDKELSDVWSSLIRVSESIPSVVDVGDELENIEALLAPSDKISELR